MSVGSFLKKVGLDALEVVQAGTKIIPMLQPFAGLVPNIGATISADLSLIKSKLDTGQAIANQVQAVEQVMAIANNGASGTGAQKAAAVGAALPAILQDIELLGGKTLGKKFNDLSDDKKKAFNAQCGKIAGDFADLLNILES
jgi:hypothetical protein